MSGLTFKVTGDRFIMNEEGFPRFEFDRGNRRLYLQLKADTMREEYDVGVRQWHVCVMVVGWVRDVLRRKFGESAADEFMEKWSTWVKSDGATIEE